MAFPTTGVLDNFNRANSTTTMGSNWSVLSLYDEGATAFGINSNQAYNPSANFYGLAYWNPTTFGPDCEAWMTVATLNASTDGEGPGVYCRLQQLGSAATYDGYFAYFDLTADTWKIERIDNGVSTVITSGSVTLAAGDAIGIQAIGSTIKAFRKPAAGSWTELGSVTDSTYSGAGNIGFYGDNLYGVSPTVWRFDDFGGGTIKAPPRRRNTIVPWRRPF